MREQSTIRLCESQLCFNLTRNQPETAFQLRWMKIFYRKIVRESDSENYLDLIFAAPPYKKVIILPDTNYIISAIRKFMLDVPSPGSSQNIGL